MSEPDHRQVVALSEDLNSRRNVAAHHRYRHGGKMEAVSDSCYPWTVGAMLADDAIRPRDRKAIGMG